MTNAWRLARAVASCVLPAAFMGCGAGGRETGARTEAVEDIRSMQYDAATGRFNVICADGSSESVTAEQVRANDVCRGGGGGGGGGGAVGSVSFYRSDSCSGDLLATVRFSGNADWNEQRCQGLEGTISSNVWGVRLGTGACQDIADAAFGSACRRFQGVPGAGNVVSYYRSDSCSGDLQASLQFSGDPVADAAACERAGRYVSTNTWAVRLGTGACEDISDTSFASACARFQGGGAPTPTTTSVAFYRSDSCSGDLLAAVAFGLDPAANRATCERVAGSVSTNVWAVRVNGGACEDISDTSFATACLRYQ